MILEKKEKKEGKSACNTVYFCENFQHHTLYTFWQEFISYSKFYEHCFSFQ